MYFMNTEYIHWIAENRAAAVWAELREIFPELARTSIGVKINARLRSTAARCFLEHGYIDVNPRMMAANMDEFIRVIIPHELAHQAAYDLFDDCGHGQAWKDIMIMLGLPPARCHTMETA